MATHGGSYSQMKNILYPRDSYADRVKQNNPAKQTDAQQQQKKPLLPTPTSQKSHSTQSASASSETDNHLRRKIARRQSTQSNDIALSNKYNILTQEDMVVDTHPPPPETTSSKLPQPTEPEMNRDRSSSRGRSTSHSGPPPVPSAPLVKASKTVSSEKSGQEGWRGFQILRKAHRQTSS